ncbi:MAG: GrpB family protein [Candidatus Limnocylindrales bacterium]
MTDELRSDEEIAAARIGPPDVLNRPIFLAPYDPQWPATYEQEADRIRNVLGDRVRLLEHAGSTSIPGLSAKPVIDIVLALVDSSDEGDYVPAMEEAGYVLRVREPDWHEHRLFKGPDADINLHVFTVGCLEIDRMLGFRDHLRADLDDRRLYEETKQALAQRVWKYTQHYADAKTAIVEEIHVRAGVAPRDCMLHQV